MGLTVAQSRAKEILLEIIGLFHATGPKCETIEESRFYLSYGCCYEVRDLVGVILTKEGHRVQYGQNCYHTYIVVDGKAFDSLCPEGYTVPVEKYWVMDEIAPGRDVSYDSPADDFEISPICYMPYLRLQAVQRYMTKRYGLVVRPPSRKDTRYRERKRIEHRLAKKLAEGLPPVTSVHPLPSPMSYFRDVIEERSDRPLLPYPYRLHLKFWQSRVKDLKKRGVPIWQM